MKRLLTLVAFFATIQASAQQVNPVPDYVFRNQMSVGRGTVTDTAAYFSIGPRYGAVRGFMPPMVTDTATITTGKRNGLTIFSIQKNKYMYWDSVRVRWSDFAGSSGAYIFASDTASMLSPYIRHAGNGLTKSGQSLLVDTASIATRARVQKAVDSINANVALKVNITDTAFMLTPYTRGSGTTNYLPKFTGSRTFGNSNIYNDSGRVAINHTSPATSLHIYSDTTSEVLRLEYKYTAPYISFYQKTTRLGYLQFDSAFGGLLQDETNMPLRFATSGLERVRIKADGELLLNTTSDAGAYALQVDGAIYNTTGAVLAASSGNVGIGTASPLSKLQVSGEAVIANGSPTSTQNGLHLFFDTNVGYISSEQPGTTFRELRVQGTPLIAQTAGTERLRITSAGELLIGTTTDAGDYKLQVSGNIYNTGSLTTGAPSGGSIKPWKIGEAATVSPTSPNRTLRVEVDGVVYYIHAKTTND